MTTFVDKMSVMLPIATPFRDIRFISCPPSEHSRRTMQTGVGQHNLPVGIKTQFPAVSTCIFPIG